MIHLLLLRVFVETRSSPKHCALLHLVCGNRSSHHEMCQYLTFALEELATELKKT